LTNHKFDYRSDIDCLRAIAVLLVVAFHAFPAAMPGGFTGVDVFFVISGYLITGIIFRELRSGDFSPISFYARRIRRIFPALIVVLTAVIALGWFVLLPNPFAQLGLQSFAGALFFPNVLFLNQSGYFDQAAATKPLLHLWSLGVEEQFYVVWPWLLLCFQRWRRGQIIVVAILTAASLAYSVWITGHDPVTAFYSPFSRLWELGVGGLLSFLPRVARFGNLLSMIGVVVIAASAVLIDDKTPFPGVAALGPVIGATMVMTSRSNASSWKPLVSIGRISYPLYLWHWPLLRFARAAGLTSPTQTVSVVAVSFILAFMTTMLVERPIRFGGLRRFGVRASTASMLLVAAMSLVIWRSGGALWRYPSEIRPILETMNYDPRDDARMDCWLDIKAGFDTYAARCKTGATVVWGDSHAGRLYTGLRKDGGGISQFVRDGCMPIVGDASLLPVCAASNVQILKEIERTRPRRVILFAVWMRYRPDFAALEDTLRRLKGAADDVILLGPFPSFSPNLPEQAYQDWLSRGALPDRLIPLAQNYRGMDAALLSAAREAGATFVSLHDALCNQEDCLTHTRTGKSDLVSWDYGHLTTNGARFVADLAGLNDENDKARHP
jgi:peptidoglycan/LPS O-acetylase OafA/YrhL